MNLSQPKGLVYSLLVLVIAAGACGNGDDRARPRGGPGGESPAPEGPLTSGEARVEISGDIAESFNLGLDFGGTLIYQPPNGAMAVVWSNGQSRSFAIAAPFFTGTQQTSNEVSITITTSDVSLFISNAGECEITLDQADEQELQGSFSCRRLKGTNQTVNASGTFSASA
ncbi:MAG: hypothetical protein ACRDH6_04460 [Actinomycetota bacterium]